MLPQDPKDFLTGQVLLVDKPLTWTSFDVVNKIRYQLKKLLQVKKIKVGHAGTLDPLATGLLIICTGKMTKQIDTFQGLDKTYTGTLLLGKTTPSFDAETEIDAEYPIEHIDKEMLEETLSQFRGSIQQYPPMYSAIKLDGVPLYKHARNGEKKEVKARTVHIHQLNINSDRFPEIDFEVVCSKGTYIRSFAHDFGKALNSGAYLTSLKRTAIGKYKLEEAWQLEDLINKLQEMQVA